MSDHLITKDNARSKGRAGGLKSAATRRAQAERRERLKMLAQGTEGRLLLAAVAGAIAELLDDPNKGEG